MRTAQSRLALGAYFVLLCGCGGNSMKANSGFGGATGNGGSSATGGVLGSGGASGVSVTGGSAGLGSSGGAGGFLASGGVLGSGGAGGVFAIDGSAGVGDSGGAPDSGGSISADASATRDASKSPDAPLYLCRPPPPCPAGWSYVYNDSTCGFGGTTTVCTRRGDGLCYQECTTDSDCANPSFPKCGSIDVAGGTDYASPKRVCVGSVGACREDAGSS